MLGADVPRCLAQALLAARGVRWAGPRSGLFVLLVWFEGTGEAFFTPALHALTVEMAPPGTARQRERAVRAGQVGDHDRRAGAGRCPRRPDRAGRRRGRGRGVLRGERAGAEPAPLPGGRDGASRAPAGTSRGAPDPVARHGRGLGRVPVPDLAVGRHRAVRLLQPDHLGAVDAARPGHGPRVPGRLRGVGRDHGGTGRGRDRGRAAVLGRRPRRPMVVATIATFCYALPDIPMALHARWSGWPPPRYPAARVGACPVPSSGRPSSSRCRRTSWPGQLAVTFPAYGIGVIGYAIDGPLAGVFGPQLVFGVGAVYGLLSTAVVLALPSVRAVTWRGCTAGPAGEASAASPPRAARRRQPAGPPP